MKATIKTISLILTLFALQACGGGGGSSNTPADQPTGNESDQGTVADEPVTIVRPEQGNYPDNSRWAGTEIASDVSARIFHDNVLARHRSIAFASDGHGAAIALRTVSEQQEEGARRYLLASHRDAEGNWRDHVLPNTFGHFKAPLLKVADDGSATAIWGNSSIHAARFDPAQDAWISNGRIDRHSERAMSNGAHDPVLALDEAGNATAMWIEPRTETGSVAERVWFAQRSAEGEWGHKQVLPEQSSRFLRPLAEAANNANGEILLPFIADNYLELYNFVPGEGWQRSYLFQSRGQHVRSPHAVIDDAGNAWLSWMEFDQLSGAWDILVSHRPAPGNQWGAPERLVQNAGTPFNSYGNYTPELKLGRNGQLFLSWRLIIKDSNDEYESSDLRVMQYSPLTGWSTQSSLSPRGDSHSVFFSRPELAVGDTGDAVMIWQGFYSNEEGRNAGVIFASKFSPVSGWSDPVLVNDGESMVGFFPQVASLGNTGFLAVWDVSHEEDRRLRSNQLPTARTSIDLPLQ